MTCLGNVLGINVSVIRFGMFACLSESGADPTIESDSGFNAMDMAVAMGHRNGTCKLNSLSLHLRQCASADVCLTIS